MALLRKPTSEELADKAMKKEIAAEGAAVAKAVSEAQRAAANAEIAARVDRCPGDHYVVDWVAFKSSMLAKSVIAAAANKQYARGYRLAAIYEGHHDHAVMVFEHNFHD